VLHQGGADAPILHCRIDGDGSQPDDWRTLIDEVAADNTAVEFGNDAVRGTRASSRQQTDRDIGIAERGRKIVLRCDRREGLVADPAGLRHIRGLDRP
jgi:hypothetical protein